jgi:multiple sugar transport system substrate-binding protein
VERVRAPGRRSRRLARLASSGLLAGAAAIGCGVREEATAIDFWALGREGEVVQRLMPEFERRTPGLRVRVQQIPWSAAHEKLLTAYAGDALPDLLQLGTTWLPEFVALRAVAPVGERMVASTSIASDDYFPGILEMSEVDGTLYGVPWYVDTRVLFYRSDLLARAGFQEPPRTWSAWLDAMIRLEAVVGADHFAILLSPDTWEPQVILALQLGAALLRDGDRRGDFQSPRFREAFRWYLDLFERGLAPSGSEGRVGNVYRDFAAGHFAMLVSGPWDLGELARRLPAELDSAWATAPLPAPREDGPGASLAGGASLVLTRSSPRQAEAWKLVEYLSEPEQQVALHRLSGDLPARRSAWRLSGLASDPRARAFWVQLDALASTPRIPEWERIASRIAHYSEEAVRGHLAPEAALAALDRDVDAILEKRRWLLRGRPAGAAEAKR